MLIRLFVLLLVFANLIFFAWTQGYLGDGDNGHESQRFEQQLQADKLAIVRIDLAVAAKDEIACRLVRGLSAAEAELLTAAVKAQGGTATILPPEGPPRYLVLVADLADEAVAERKAAEIRRFGVKEFEVIARDGGRYEIVLGSFEREAAAIDLLDKLGKRRIKSAQVERRDAPEAKVEVRAPASVLLRQLPLLIAPFAEATLGDCNP